MSKDKPRQELPGWIAEHTQLYLQDPDKGHAWDSTAAGGPGVLLTLLLYTVGRKSGKTGVLPLLYGKSGENYVIIASKGGAPDHPAWYLNLQHTPDCEIQVAHDRFRVRARTATGAEREALWQLMAGIYPPYNDYQKATSRQIPVVVLERSH
jgi:deazaflavin-dependent oxidoreductase (nitroreductase family)